MPSTAVISALKDKIAENPRSRLPSQFMKLTSGTTVYGDDLTLEQCGLTDGSKIKMIKKSLSDLPGIKLSDKKCCVMQDDSEPRAEMPCGHAIMPESMVALIRSLISDSEFAIYCPDLESPGKKCKYEWDFELCMRVGLMTR
jgi:hypothetical protein